MWNVPEKDSPRGATAYHFGDLLRDVTEDLRHSGRQNIFGLLTRLLFDSGFQLIALYRFSHWAVQGRLAFLCAPCTWLQHLVAASEINPRARIGARIRMPHPTGIVIGVGVVVEDEVYIFQQVTLGAHGGRALPRAYSVIRRGAYL